MGFGSRLRQKRIDKGLTQEQLGEGLGTNGKNVGKAVVYGWEKEQHFPRVDQLELMCRKHGWSADYLVLDEVKLDDLLPKVAEVAKAINGLPGPQLEWVLDVVQRTLVAAKEFTRITEEQVTHPARDAVLVGEPASSKRTKTV